jgi:hypothetical protein
MYNVPCIASMHYQELRPHNLSNEVDESILMTLFQVAVYLQGW